MNKIFAFSEHVGAGELYPRGKQGTEERMVSGSLPPFEFNFPHLSHPNPSFTAKDKRQFQSKFQFLGESSAGYWILFDRYGFVQFSAGSGIEDVVHLPRGYSLFGENRYNRNPIFYKNDKVLFQLRKKDYQESTDLVTLDLSTETWNFYRNPIFSDNDAYRKNHELGTKSLVLTDTALYLSYLYNVHDVAQLYRRNLVDMNSGVVRLDLNTKSSSTLVSNQRRPAENPVDSYYSAHLHHPLEWVGPGKIMMGSHLYQEETATWRRTNKDERRQLNERRLTMSTDAFEIRGVVFKWKTQTLLCTMEPRGDGAKPSEAVRFELHCDLSQLMNYKPPAGWNRLFPEWPDYNLRPRVRAQTVSDGVFLHNNLGFTFLPAAVIEHAFEQALPKTP
jgi:hypothetical protein